MKSRILYTKPSIKELEVRYSSDAAASGWRKSYENINRFEEMTTKNSQKFMWLTA